MLSLTLFVIFPMALAPLCSEQIARVQVLVFTGNSRGGGTETAPTRGCSQCWSGEQRPPLHQEEIKSAVLLFKISD